MKLSITQKCVSEFLCVCVSKRSHSGRRRVCFTKRCWRVSCSPQHLTAFHLPLLLDQPRAAVTSPFPELTSHTHTLTLTHTQPGNHWLTSVTKTFWLVSWSPFRRGKGRREWLSISNQGVNMHNGGLIWVLTQSKCRLHIYRLCWGFFLFKLLWKFGCRCHSLCFVTLFLELFHLSA